MSFKPRTIGPFNIPPIGLGCMNLTHAYGHPPSPDDAARLLLAAVDAGVVLFDTAALYGFGSNEELVGRVLGSHREQIVLATKCGMTGVDGVRAIDGRPQTLLRTADEALTRLGTDVIDLYHLHRVVGQNLPRRCVDGFIGRAIAGTLVTRQDFSSGRPTLSDPSALSCSTSSGVVMLPISRLQSSSSRSDRLR